jgi:hypothetical protein
VEEQPVDEAPEEFEQPIAEEAQPVEAVSLEEEPDEEPAAAAVAKAAPGFSKLLDSLAGLTGFYGSQPVKVEPIVAPEPEPEPKAQAEADPEFNETFQDEQATEEPVEQPLAEEPVAEEPVAEDPVAEEPVAEGASVEEPKLEEPLAKAETEKPARKKAEQPAALLEGTLQSKLADVRARADEARQARLAATAALYEGLGAAYDFALDAESEPEEYLRLVESKGLKIQLRAPMKPVVKLAFDGLADEQTIAELEAVLAWALKQDLPRGTLPARIEDEGGLGKILG